MGSTKQDDINYSFLWFLPPQCSVQILVVVTTPTTSATTPRPTRSCTWGGWPRAFRTVTYLPHLVSVTTCYTGSQGQDLTRTARSSVAPATTWTRWPSTWVSAG